MEESDRKEGPENERPDAHEEEVPQPRRGHSPQSLVTCFEDFDPRCGTVLVRPLSPLP